MRDQAKPLRTMLYVPANKEDWVRKAPKYGADALILDIEDSVPLDEKQNAREIVSRMVPELAAEGITVLVRVNDLDTGFTAEDVSYAVQEGLYAITLPMVKGASDVKELDSLISREEKKKNIDAGKVLIDPGLETATGLRFAYEVGTSSDRVAHMGAGGGRGGDIARAVGYQWTPEGTEISDTLSYNPWFPGNGIAMYQPLYEESVEYEDGTFASIEQMSADVTAFLAWSAEPEMEERKRLGFIVMSFLIIFVLLMFFTTTRLWKDVH